MNLQAHMTGQISGQVPNQGTMPSQNRNAQMQNIGVGSAPTGSNIVPPRNPVGAMDHELLKLRQYMRNRIFNILQQRQPSPGDDASRAKYMDVARRLEEGLLKMAVTKEDYMNPQTLEARLTTLIKGRQLNNYNQRHANPSSVGTMIPTPGLPHVGGNQNLMVNSSIDSSMVESNNTTTTAVNTGSLLSSGVTHGGNLSNGYLQSSANFSVGSGGNMSSFGSQSVTSQMIPTPGFNNSSKINNTNSDSQSYMTIETSNNSGGISAVESMIVQQTQQQQRQRIGGQNSRILHNLGSQMGAGFRSGMQQKSYGLINGSVNGGMGMNGNNVQLGNEPRTSEGFVNGPPYTNSNRNIPQAFDNLQRLAMHGEGYAASNPDHFGSGNIFGAVTSDGSMTNTQNINSVDRQSISRTNSSLVSMQSNQQGMRQGVPLKHESVDPFQNMNFQSALPLRQHLLQSHQQQQFQQQPTNHFQQQQQFVHPQRQLKQQSQQQQRLMNNDGYGQSQLASDLVPQVKHELRLQNQSEVSLSQSSEKFHMSELQNQFMNCGEDHPVGGQLLSVPTHQHDICSPLQQNAQQMQQNESGSLSIGAKLESGLQDQWHSQLQDNTQMSRSMSSGQHFQEDFHQRISGIDDAQPNKLSEGSVIDRSLASGVISESQNPQNSMASACRSGDGNRDPRFRNQQRWLLFLRHARTCKAPEGKCQDPNCITVQKLWRHMDTCNAPQCTFPRCHHTKTLINHHRNCKDPQCPVCVPVKSYLQQQAKARALARSKNNSSLPGSTGGSGNSNDTGHASAATVSNVASCADIAETLQPASKRLKPEQSAQPAVPETENSTNSVTAVTEAQSSWNAEKKDYQYGDARAPIKSEAVEVKVDVPVVPIQEIPGISQTKVNTENMHKQRRVSESLLCNKQACSPEQETVKLERETGPPKKENPTQPCEPLSKSGKPEIKGVSLTELFTPEQVREHIRGLRQWVGQSRAKAEKNQAMEHSMSENSCQLCAVEKLTFEPPPIYCTPCGARIKRNAMYYTVGTGDTRHYFCIPCYNESRGDTIVAEGTSIQKSRLEKKKNDEETEEWWVQCDKCEAWQHQICALFNGRRNDGGQAEYTCPYCYIAEVERGERRPLPQSAVLGAKDLPRTILSDHIEQRLFRSLKHERTERARVQGKSYDKVPGAEALVVRVVSSVDKKLEVKPRFLEIFREENYPTEFPYKSKVVLLFQNIEGVEVCLFGMYVQEFGTESAFPNQRRVYLSYLDSVKYFRPEVKAASGEALRTFVYHEILIGYLEYCKLRGFTSCYIWACPPLKGEDYILYCHPEIQKTPKSDKLREWYLSMLRKAAKESIVVECTNLYDHFFIQTGESRAKVTAARLPYFDGDYWPGAAEDLIDQMNQEEDGRKSNKRGTIKKTITKRALKATGQSDLSGNASKDLLLMHKLGETIHPMKEDFIMVHLQYCCTQCCILMVSGNRWVCNECKNFQICDKCYEAEKKREDRERHPVNQKEKHTLYPFEITDVPADTKDKDEILESEFFDTRQAFLSLCQGNHYQYDTLRRAKHSSMMVLYHLHNPTAPAFVTTCNVCHLDIETGQGWRCEVCPDYDVCNACYSKDSGINHPHKLTNHPSLADQNAQNKEARQLRVLQLRKMLDLLVHASQCRSPHCQYPNCRKVKGLFRHGIQCRVRASGGCVLCKKMWYLLQLHARACKESQCHVPRCKDLKEHLRRLQQQSDSRRRAAVMEMMRQRAAEVAGNSG